MRGKGGDCSALSDYLSLVASQNGRQTENEQSQATLKINNKIEVPVKKYITHLNLTHNRISIELRRKPYICVRLLFNWLISP